MCIIIVKNSGTNLPNDDIINRCWKNNPDGAGYMFHDNGQVHIKKGFMNLGDFKRNLKSENFTLKDEVIMHFRIKTSGKSNASCTHPFPLSRKISALRQLDITCNKGVAHNGIIGAGEKKISDTMVFIKDILADGVIHNNLHKNSILELITDYLGLTNKLAIMDRFGVILLGQKWICDELTDLWFSNDGYKTIYVATHHSFQRADYHYNDDKPFGGDGYESDSNNDGIYEDTKTAPHCPICILNEFIILDHQDFYRCDNCETVFDDEYNTYEDEDNIIEYADDSYEGYFQTRFLKQL